MDTHPIARKGLFALLAVAVLSLAFMACSGEKAPPSVSADPLVVGAILPMTGPYARYGIEERQAALLALDEGVGDDIRVIFADSAGDSDQAMAHYKRLTTSEHAMAVFTSASWISNAIYPLAAQENVLQVVVASGAFTRSLKTDGAVRFTVGIPDEAARLEEYLKQFKRAALLYMDNDFGKDWTTQLKNSLKDRVVAAESYAPDATDYSRQLTAVQSKAPDVLVLLSSDGQAALIAPQARQRGLNAPSASTRPVEGPLLFQGGDAVNGLVYSYPSFDTKHPFVKKFKDKYNAEPTVFGAEMYDAIVTLARAHKQCGNKPTCLADSYRGKSLVGALGKVTFDKAGDAHYPIILKQAKDGTFQPYP